MTESQSAWVIVSKDTPVAGVYPACPVLRCGRKAPPLPLAIQCVSRAEAQALFAVIRPVLATLPATPSTSELLNAFRAADAVRNFFNSATNTQFFVVIVGSPPGIHRSRDSAEGSRGSFSHPSCRQMGTFWEALAFLIVKGNDDLMPPFDDSPDPSSLSADMEFLARGVQFNFSLTPSPTQPRIPASDPAPQFAPSKLHNSYLPGIASQTPASQQGTQTAPMPFVSFHIRNLHGIIGSRYYAALPALDDAHVHAVGPQAARYLVAHGYTAEAVDIIVRTREATTTSSYQFALQLSTHGMALEEAMYLHGLFE